MEWGPRVDGWLSGRIRGWLGDGRAEVSRTWCRWPERSLDKLGTLVRVAAGGGAANRVPETSTARQFRYC